MEISNEIKAKVFAGYLGQKIIYPMKKDGKYVYDPGFSPVVCFNPMQLNKMYQLHDTDVKLLLTPLSSITDEDAIEVCKIVKYYDYNKTDVRYQRLAAYLGKGICLFHFDNWRWDNNHEFDGAHTRKQISEPHPYFILPISQYLQSKGYDLPHYLLGGKTLIESGLALSKQSTTI